MTQINDNTISRKGTHLSYSERCQICRSEKGKLFQPAGCQCSGTGATNDSQRNQTRNHHPVETPEAEWERL